MTAIAKATDTLAEEFGIGPRELAMLTGDLSKLSEGERGNLVNALCLSLGLNPLTRPFEYIVLNGKLTLYARKDCTEQLRSKHSVSVEIVARENVGDCYVVTAQAKMPSGRLDESIGAVAIANLKGDNLANALMKAETKAKRRVTLSICGMGMLDETELETIPAKAKRDVAPALPPPPGNAELVDAIHRAHKIGAIAEPKREALTAWADEHGLLANGRLTPSALTKIIAALDAAQDVAVNLDAGSTSGASPDGSTEAAPVAATSAATETRVYEPEPDEADERKKLYARLHLAWKATGLPDARRKARLRAKYPAIYADVKPGEESSTKLPLAHLQAFTRDIEAMEKARPQPS